METTTSPATEKLSFLTKSDYTLARNCESKLYYRKRGYPSNAGDNPQLETLARGGYQIEALARALRPEGIALVESDDPVADHAASMALLAAKRVTLFNATFLSGGRLARVDILEKDGDTLRIVEVKARSFKYREHLHDLASGGRGLFRGGSAPFAVRNAWREKLEDVTFQWLVLTELFPKLTVEPYLLLVDTEKETARDYEPLRFEYEYRTTSGGQRQLKSVRYIGSATEAAGADIFAQVNVAAEVAELKDTVARLASKYGALLESWSKGGACPVSPLGAICRDCEFRLETDSARHGFAECWGALGRPSPHLLELYKVGRAVGLNGGRLIDEMLEEGKAALVEVREDLLEDSDQEGSDDFRRAIQVRHSRSGTPWYGPGLQSMLASAVYPLHFIDFETSNVALPYYARMRPYGTVAFQLSCHTIATPGAEPTHTEWLNDGRIWCNGQFAEALRNTIGDHGSVLTWAKHEATVMRHIANDLEQFDPSAIGLADWLRSNYEGSRIIDLNRETLRHFFHPAMGGRTSVKVVLKALWKADATLRNECARWMDLTVGSDESPYDALPPLNVAGLNLSVREGTGAMIAYEDMMYGAGKSDQSVRSAWRELLLRYCKLDTLAMVLIWKHWQRELTASE